MSGRRLWQVFIMLGGFIMWAAQFTIIYGATSTICGLGAAETKLFGVGIVPVAIAGGTVAALAGAAGVLAHALQQHRHLQQVGAAAADVFLSQAAILISGFSIVAIIWQSLPALILPACA